MSSQIDFSHKKIAILGFGVEGKSALHILSSKGAQVTVYDTKPENAFDKKEISDFQAQGIIFKFEAFSELDSYDLIVRSPGVPVTHPELIKIPKDTITSVTKLFFDLCPCPIIGVTGTKGKGTTSSLIYKMLKAGGKDAYLGGNIGTPALDFLQKLTQDSIAVLELSSFQLADLHKSPHIAVMLMVTSEHLDIHKDVDEYVDAKRNILKFQISEDYAILNKDYPASNESDVYTDAQVFFISREHDIDRGCFVKDRKIVIRYAGKDEIVIPTNRILLPGKHNLENVCAAVMAAKLAGVGKHDIATVLRSFKGLEHRLELVRTVKGVRYYDDSFSTTPETAEAAIEAFEDPKILILGGSSKNSDFTRLGELISKTESIKGIIGIGEEWERMKVQFPNPKFEIIEECKTMNEIVQKASELGEPGGVVLLSPACASFDMFKDYKDRG
ncbi:MAG TPA: UDP-N-acetylmuramoyl-L-alanine--D-glutamate ligase, partial [Candidatus Levybacteria bacterium]|nr:UDP-N-acetylmuramoyl-L-alanine--D-glutamate ligase [Candidatus Levybacteria bacterium]